MPAMYTNQVFPGGRAKTLVITATAGNVVTNLSPGIGLRWIIRRGLLSCTADATVANRYIRVQTTDSANITEELFTSAMFTATQTGGVTFGESHYSSGGLIGGLLSYVGIQPIIVSDAEQLRISVLGGVAGDSYTGHIDILEMAVD